MKDETSGTHKKCLTVSFGRTFSLEFLTPARCIIAKHPENGGFWCKWCMEALKIALASIYDSGNDSD